jgi:hypothetical protein
MGSNRRINGDAQDLTHIPPPRNKVLLDQDPKAPRHGLFTPLSIKYPLTKVLINWQQSCGV